MDAGASLYGADEFSGFVKGVHRAGIEPSVAAPQGDYIQISFLEIDLIEICDLKLTSRGGLHLFRVFADILIVEIESGKRIEDHRFVINGKQLLRSDHSQRIEPCVGTSS